LLGFSVPLLVHQAGSPQFYRESLLVGGGEQKGPTIFITDATRLRAVFTPRLKWLAGITCRAWHPWHPASAAMTLRLWHEVRGIFRLSSAFRAVPPANVLAEPRGGFGCQSREGSSGVGRAHCLCLTPIGRSFIRFVNPRPPPSFSLESHLALDLAGPT